MSIGDWWRKLRGQGGAGAPAQAAPDPALLAELQNCEKLAEEAYDAMYDARRPKDFYEDASLYFHRAIELARRLGRVADVERLTQRQTHVRNVYDHQFRGV